MDDPLPQELYERLACPDDKTSVRYTKDKKGLVCGKCGCTYPIKNGIPVMLPPKERASQDEPSEAPPGGLAVDEE